MAGGSGMASKRSKKTTRFARGGAAAFAVGVFLAGPAAIAAADGGADASAGASSSGSAGSGSRAVQGPSRAALGRSCRHRIGIP